ncbi:MAG: hypothetical protein HYR61_18665 [Acidobacteria bacterium]|nr:hypothetical protein [Acidobacteriota bacterium]
MLPLIGAAVSALAPSLGSVVGGIASQALGGLLGGGGGGGGPLGQIGGLLKNTLGKLFGGKRKHHHHCPPKPLPFRPQCTTHNTNININNNFNAPMQAFRGLGQQLGQIANTLNQILGQLRPGGGPSGPGGHVPWNDFPKLPPIATSPGGPGPGLPGGGGIGEGVGSSIPAHGNLDDLMASAQKDAADGTMEGAMRAQEKMQKAMRTFELLSKLMENQSQMQSKAIGAMR